MKTDAAVPARILLVDDNRHGLAARRMILEEHGYAVETAMSGEAGWEIFQASPFDIVVTDFRMGGMDGMELIRLIRASESPARIVLLSGFVECLGMTEESTGADEVMMKSNMEVQELVRAVKKLLNDTPRRKPPSPQRPTARKSTRVV